MSTTPRHDHRFASLMLVSTCFTLVLAGGSAVYGNEEEIPPIPTLLMEPIQEEVLPSVSDDEREQLLYGFALREQSKLKTVTTFREQADQQRQKRLQHLSDCREEMRHANRDTQFPTAKRCFRAQLTLELSQLRKDQSFYAERNGASIFTRTMVTESITELTDAITAIIDGIDTGVYVSIDGLAEAKINLANMYRAPYWQALRMLDADRLITWNEHLQQSGVRSSAPIETESGALSLSECYQEASLPLADTLEADNNESVKTSLNQGLIFLEFCNAGSVPVHSAAEVEPDEEPETVRKAERELPRRLLRHLNET